MGTQFLNGFSPQFEQFSAKVCPWDKMLCLCRRKCRWGAGDAVHVFCGKRQRGLDRVVVKFGVRRQNDVNRFRCGKFLQDFLKDNGVQ